MKRSIVFLLMALIGISAFFSCRKEGAFSEKAPNVDSLSYYDNQLNLAKEYLIADKDDSSVCLVNQLLDHVERLPSSQALLRIKSQAYNILGCSKATSNRPEAIELFKKACDYAIQSNYSQFLYGVYANLADAYTESGNVVKGIFYLHKALLLSDSLNLPKKDCFLIYYGLGRAYLALRDFEQSDYYHKLASQQYECITPHNQFLYLCSKTNLYYYQDEYQAALSYMMRALVITKSHPEMNNERGGCYVNLADLYLKLEKLDSTEILLAKSRPLFEQSRNLSGIYYVETLQIQLALRRGDLSEAFALLSKPVVDSLVVPDMFAVRQKSLQTYYEEVGNYREALRYFKAGYSLSVSHDDSIARRKCNQACIAWERGKEEVACENLFIRERGYSDSYTRQWTRLWRPGDD